MNTCFQIAGDWEMGDLTPSVYVAYFEQYGLEIVEYGTTADFVVLGYRKNFEDVDQIIYRDSNVCEITDFGKC